MANESTAIIPYDPGSRALTTVRSVNREIVVMQDELRRVDRYMDMAFSVMPVMMMQPVIYNTYQTLQLFQNPIKAAAEEQDKLNEQMGEGEKKAGRLEKTIKGLVTKYLNFKNVKGFLTESIDLANKQIMAEQRLQSVMDKNPDMSQESIDSLKSYASKLQAVTTISDEVGIQGMSQLAYHVQDPANIQALTTAMYDLAAGTYGAQVSMDDIKRTSESLGKALSGDANALAGVLPAGLSDDEKKILQLGTEAERTALVVQKIGESYGGLAQAMAQTPQGQAERLNNEWNSFKETIGVGFMPIWTSLMDMMMTTMPAIQQTLTTVFSALIGLLESILPYVTTIVEFIVSNWPWIEPIIWGIVAAFTAWKVATHLVEVAQRLLNTTMKANVFILILSLIAGLIIWILKLWNTNDQFRLGFMKAWFGILNWFEQVPIFFMRISNGITTAIESARVKSLEIMDAFINAVIDDLNKLIEILNMIPGVSLEAVSHVSFAASEEAAAEARRQAREAKIKQMEDVATARAAKREQELLDLAEDLAARRAKEEAEQVTELIAKEETRQGPGSDQWEATADDNIDSVKNVGEVGKIRDSVDISSEDLKMMRELAEMSHIQNFVTLHPQISFGDTHIRQDGRSVDEIVSNITQRLTEEISSSAQGVYGFG